MTTAPARASDQEELTRLQLELRVARQEIEGLHNRFGLVWETRREDVDDNLFVHEIPVLTPDADRVVRPQAPRPHILIEGENLHALSCLQYTHAGAIDVIYIDPPYNTGKEFTYNDRLVGADDAWRHSKWLSFMHRRLVLARTLLKDTGVILISIDDHEQAHLKLLCDQVFGPSNFVAQLVWEGGRKNDSRFVSVGHDYVLCYARDRQALLDADVHWRERKLGMDEILAAGARCWDESGHVAERATTALKAWFVALPKDHPARAHKHYNHICEKTGRVFFPDNISWPGGGGPTYEVRHPVTGRPVTVPLPGWRYSTPERMQELIDAGRVFFGPNEKKVPNRKSYLDEIDSQVPTSVFQRDRRAANKELAAQIGSSKFKFSKNADVLARWLSIVGERDAIVLDFFAGSGTTAQAVAELNAADGGTRQAILVTNNENGICDNVTWPRLRNVLTGNWADGKEHAPLPGSLRYYRCETVPYSRNRDTVLRRLAESAAGMVAVREGVHDIVTEERECCILHGSGRLVVIWLGWTTENLENRLEVATLLCDDPADERVLYLFTLDEDLGLDAGTANTYCGWRLEALPSPIQAALEKAHRRSRGPGRKSTAADTA